jgi:hypothetical protein
MRLWVRLPSGGAQASVGGTAATRWGADNETVGAIDEYPRILASHSARDDTARRSLRVDLAA